MMVKVKLEGSDASCFWSFYAIRLGFSGSEVDERNTEKVGNSLFKQHSREAVSSIKS